MRYESKDGSVQFDAYRVETVHFTGEAFSSAPFSGKSDHDWMHESIKAGLVSLVSGPDATHATWAVSVGNGEAVLASPGDYVVKPVGSETLYVCMGYLWELLTQPAQEVCETIGEVCDMLQESVDENTHKLLVKNWMDEAHTALGKDDPGTDWQALNNTAVELYEVREERGWRSGIDFVALVQRVERKVAEAQTDAKAEAVAKEHSKEFDPSEWNERVSALLDQPATAWQVNWQQLFDELKSFIDDGVEVISLPRRTFHLYGTLANMITQAPDPADRYFRNVELWLEVIRDSRAMGDKFVARVMDHRLPAGIMGDVFYVSTMPEIAPAMTPPVSVAVTDKDGNVCGTAHVGEVVQLEPRNLKEVFGVATDAEVRQKVCTEMLAKVREYLADSSEPTYVNWQATCIQIEYARGVMSEQPDDIEEIWQGAKLRYFQSRMNAWCDKVHREYLKLSPTKLRDWVALGKEVEIIMGDRDPSSLPRAWLITYGTVHAMGKQFCLMKPGIDEESALMTAKNISATMANQYLGTVE